MTDLQDLYDSFFLKVPNEDFTFKESLVYALINPAIAKVYKQLRHDYTYIADEDYNGYFNSDMDLDEIELIALQMAYEYERGYNLGRLAKMKQLLGTKDFDKLPDLKKQMDTVKVNIESILSQIIELKNDMNDYYGHS